MTVAIVGGGVLALPTGLAALGPMAAVGVILGAGVLNMATMHALAWSVSATTAVSSGRGSLGVLTNEHLGERVASMTTVMASLKSFASLVVYGVGLSLTLGDLVAGPLWWAAIAFGVVTVVVAAGARSGFVASSIAVGALNLVLLVAMIALVAVHAQGPIWAGPPDGVSDGGAQMLDLVLGTVLFTFFGHLALFTVAPTALSRDPSGRSLRRGAVAAMGAATLVNAAWTLVCLMTVPAQRFVEASGTGLDLLVEVAGTPLKIVSAVFVVAAMGFALTNAAFQLGDMIDERLPVLRRRTCVLVPGSVLDIHDAGSFASITVTVQGRGDDSALVVRARRGRRDERLVVTGDHWDGRELLGALGVTRRGLRLGIHVDGLTAAGIVVTVETTLSVTESHPRTSALGLGPEGEDGFTAAAVAELLRRPMSLDELSGRLVERRSLDPVEVTRRLEDLVAERRIRLGADGIARAVLGSRHRAKSALVASLYAELTGEQSSETEAQRASGRELLMAGRWRAMATSAPGPLAALTVGFLIVADIAFGTLVSLAAMATIIYLGGALPLLLGASVRRRRERAIGPSGVVASGALTGILFALFLVICGAYAAVIFDGIGERLLAVGVLGSLAWAGWRSRRDGALQPRSAIVLEVRAGIWEVTCLDRGEAARFTATLDEARSRLTIEVPGGLGSPMVLAALDGGAVPAVLGAYRVTSGGVEIASGHLESTAGDHIEQSTGDGAVTVHFDLRSNSVVLADTGS